MSDHTPTGIEAEVCKDIARRQRIGITKYGTTVAGNPLSHREWLQHAYEECLDQAIYLKRAMAEAGTSSQATGAAWSVLTAYGRIALGAESIPALFMHKPSAAKFAEELEPHIGKCRPVRVTYTITPLEP